MSPSATVLYDAFPGLGLGHLLVSVSARERNRKGDAISKCGPGTVVGFHQARGALWHALRARSIGPGDRVLVPAYHCGVEVEAILDLGAAVDYYHVTSTFRSNPVDIRRRAAPATRALLLIHYFGFPQPIDPVAEICREKGWILIEDCAHSPFVYEAGGRLGRVGDLALYSLPKTLPVPDGGLLRVNRGATPAAPALEPRRLPVARQIVRLAVSGLQSSRHPLARAAGGGLQQTVRFASASARKTAVSLELSEWNPAGGGFRAEMARYRLSEFSRRILGALDLEEVAARRRRNYERLSRRLHTAREGALCIPELPADACPMVMPVRSRERDRLGSDLLRKGIGTFVFGKNLHPTLNRAEFPEAGELSDSILGLPVHQDLGDRAMDVIADSFLAATGSPSEPVARDGEGR